MNDVNDLAGKTSYPVVEERRLLAVTPAGLFGRRRRDLNELPSRAPGTALVFQADGRFIVYDELRHLDGQEDFVLGALTVAVVNVRPYSFHADINLPSAHHSENFVIRTTFSAVVRDPSEVVRMGAIDLPNSLSQHLRKDPKLAAICAAHKIEQIADTRIEIDARVQSYYGYRSYQVPGLDVGLELVEVITPKELEERDRKLRNATVGGEIDMKIQELEFLKRKQNITGEHELTALSSRFEYDRTSRQMELEHLENLKEGKRRAEIDDLARQLEAKKAEFVLERLRQDLPAQLSLAVARGELSTLDALEAQRKAEQLNLEQLKGMLGLAMNGSGGDFFVMDPQTIFDTLIHKIGGPSYAALDSAASAERQAVTGPGPQADADVPPDEDDFHV